MIQLSNMISKIIQLIIQTKFVDYKKFKEKQHTLYNNVFVNINEEYQRVKSYIDNRKLYWTFTEQKKIPELEEYLITYRKIEQMEENDSIILKLKKEFEEKENNIIDKYMNETITIEEKKKSQYISKDNSEKLDRLFKDDLNLEELVEISDINYLQDENKKKGNGEIFNNGNIVDIQKNENDNLAKFIKTNSKILNFEKKSNSKKKIVDQRDSVLEDKKVEVDEIYINDKLIKEEEEEHNISLLKAEINRNNDNKIIDENMNKDFNELKDLDLNKEIIVITDANLNHNNIHLKDRNSINKILIENDVLKIKPLTIHYHKMIPLKNWNLKLKKTFKLSQDYIYATCYCVNNESENIYLGTKSGKIIIHKILTGEFISSLYYHKNSITSICYLNDGNTIISADKDGYLIKWDITVNQYEIIDLIKNCSIKNITYLFDGQHVCFSIDTKIYIYDILLKKEVNMSSFILLNKIIKVLWIEELKCLAIGMENGSINVFSIINLKKKLFCEFTQQNQKINDLQLCSYKNSNVLVSCSDNAINFYDVSNKNFIKTLNSPHPENIPIKKLVNCHDNRTIATGHNDGRLYFTNYFSNTKINKQFSFKSDKIKFINYSGDGITFICGYKNSEVDILICK